MSIPVRHGFIALMVCAFNLQFSIVNAQTTATNASHNQTISVRAAAIPFDQIGAMAGKQYSGNGLSVAASPDGATLHCVFQRLNAHATTEGFWLVSSKDGAKGTPFRVIARALGRNEMQMLPLSGKVEVDGQTAQFIRPGLIEEYSVGIDGLQQDFVIEQRPEGKGPLQLELEVDGAKAEPMADGARLVLADGGRNMVYNRVKAVDARGKQLPARLEVLSANRLAVILDDTAAQYPVRIDPTFSDANWISLGGLPGVNGVVYASAMDSASNLYIGGSFTIAGSVFATNIAEWNGSSWSALGSGISGESGGYNYNLGDTGPAVYALAILGTNLFVGGMFTNAGGISANDIAEWNGKSWSAVSSGVSGDGDGDGPYVGALAVSGTKLFVGGDFSTAGEASASDIAEWNGSSWSALGSGMNSGVNAFAVSGTNLYAGGDFTTAGEVAANYIAEWNGSSWSALGSGINGSDDEEFVLYVSALAVSGTNLFVGGAFSTAGEISANGIAEWNGSSWSALGLGVGEDVANGDNIVSALVVSGTNLYAGGDFTTAGEVAANYIAEWNGSSWLALGSGITGYVNTLAVSGTNLFAGGEFAAAGGVLATSIAEWNGSSWLALGSGMFSDGGNGSVVFALAVMGTNLFAGGSFTTAGGVPATNIAEWNGSSWSALGSGMNSGVNAFAVSGTNLYAGGFFTAAGGVSATSIAEWNGSSWSALGSGMNGYVYSLAVSGNILFAGGNFNFAGEVPANDIAVWDGSSWSALGSGMNSGVNALAISGNSLFVGGEFTTAGTNVSAYLAEANIAPPMITGEPSNVTLPIGDTANFGVSATGSLGLDYQWSFNTNTLLTTATNASLAIASAITNDDGYYQVVVSNLFGSATSDVASLTVLVEPNMADISNNPSGGTTTLSMGSYPGSTNYLYGTTNLALPLLQWQLVATNIAAPDGLFQIVDPNTKGVPAKFYRLSSQLIAQTISYIYTGQPFTYAIDGLTTANYISGSVTLPSVLASNLTDAVVSPLSYSFTDGLHTVNQANTLVSFVVSTDANGALTAWDFTAYSYVTGDPQFEMSWLLSGQAPTGTAPDQDTVSLVDVSIVAQNTDLPGTWSSTGTNVIITSVQTPAIYSATVGSP